MAIDPTVGGASANSYVSLAEAATYFGTRAPSADWDALADDAAKEIVLKTAARRIEQEQFKGASRNPLTGTSTGTTQALKWPRMGVVSDEGWTYLDTIIPDRVKRAQMELAYVVAGDATFLADSGLEGFVRVKVGPIDVEPLHTRLAGELPEAVRRELSPLTTGAGISFPLVRA